jgi:quinol-cytochrome oxidoreductase complex cytochrome b subunit
LGALVVCVVSGLVLLAGFEPGRAAGSILDLETSRPWAWFFRALHAWSALLLLVGLAAHTWDFVARGAERAHPRVRWALVTATLPVTLYLMLGGLALTGDAESNGVLAVMRGITEAVPWFGGWAAKLLIGDGGRMVLYVHHVLTATLVLAVLVVVHLRKGAIPGTVATAAALGISGLVALVLRPSLGPLESVEPLRGPWFMTGLRWMLERAPVWLAGLVLPAALLLVIAALPWLPERAAPFARRALAAAVLAYAALTAGAMLWQ